MTGKIMPPRERDTSTVQAAAGAFLSSPRYANPNTRRGYTGVLDRLLASAQNTAANPRPVRPARLQPLIGQHCGLTSIPFSHAYPELWILRRLDSHPTIMIVRQGDWPNIVPEIIQHQVPILYAYDENQVMLSRR